MLWQVGDDETDEDDTVRKELANALHVAVALRSAGLTWKSSD